MVGAKDEVSVEDGTARLAVARLGVELGGTREEEDEGAVWVREDMAEAISFSFASENCERMDWIPLTGKLGIWVPLVVVVVAAVTLTAVDSVGCVRGRCWP